MTTTTRALFALFLIALVYSCTQDELINPLDARLNQQLRSLAPNGTIEDFVLPAADDYAAIPAGRQNPITSDKVALGQQLFYETGLARDARYAEGIGSYSCSSCHVPAAGFTPGRAQGIADGGRGFGYTGEARTQHYAYAENEIDVQGARPLSLLNVAYVTNTTWSGKFGAYHANEGTEEVWGHPDKDTEINHLGLDGLESQNIEGLIIHRMSVDEYVLDTLGYRSMFDAAFADWEVDERYTRKATSFAISAYLRTLLTTEAPWQEYLKGNQAALDDIEKQGALLFYGKAGCYRCHQGPAMSSVSFYALGVNDLDQHPASLATGPDDIRNKGRGGFTGLNEDLYKFKVPGIYNMADAGFYFHGSSKETLREVVEYFNAAEPENDRVPQEQLAPQFHPLHLTEAEVDALTYFLEHSLRDPNLERYVPSQTRSGNCFPNNDSQSRIELGCN